MKKRKPKKWIKFRHKVIRGICYYPVKLYCRIKYRVKTKIYKHGKKENYVVLSNHQTDGDQLFAYLVFHGPLYVLATEDVFSNGLYSRILEYVVAPIPFNKSEPNMSAIMNCMKIAKAGGSLYICAEGNRTYSGKTEYIKPSIVKLIRALKLPVAILTFRGGYGVQPRWSNTTRKGKMTANIDYVINKADYDKLSDDEFYDLIVKSLTVNEGVVDGLYRGKRRAEYLERLFYTCPYCGLSEWVSDKNTATCVKCGRTVEYGEDKVITGKGFDFPFKFVNGWFEHQNEFIRNLNLSETGENPLFSDDVRISEVIVFKNKSLISKKAKLRLFKDKIECTYNNRNAKKTVIMPFNEINSVVVLGRNKLNVNFNGKIYQFKGSARFNAVKYLNFYHKNLNELKGDANGKFLGL